MRTKIALAVVLLVGTAHSPAWAAATAEEAARLTASFQAYLSDTPGVVAVAPEGTEYVVKIDFSPLLAKVAGNGFSATIAPFQFHITDLGEGKWKYREDQPYAMSLTVPGAVEAKLVVDRVTADGVYDATNMGFEFFLAEFSNMAVDELVTNPNGQINVNYDIASWKMEYAATPVADGIVDGKYTSTLTDISEEISMPLMPGQPSMPFKVKMANGSQSGAFAGLRTRALTELLAWFVAHPSEDMIKANQKELKAVLASALPLWDSMTGTSTLDGLASETPVGPVSIATIGFDADMSGFSRNGKFREKLAFTGIAPPPGIVPPWAEGLIPHAFSIDFTLSDFDLATPAQLALDNLDLNREPPVSPEVEPQLLASLLPKGAVTLSLSASEIVSKLAAISYEGTFTFGPAAAPMAKAVIRMKGMDEVIAALNAAPPEMGVGQMMPMVLMAKGLAKVEADGSLSWLIESTDGVSVTVNGVDPTKMQ